MSYSTPYRGTNGYRSREDDEGYDAPVNWPFPVRAPEGPPPELTRRDTAAPKAPSPDTPEAPF